MTFKRQSEPSGFFLWYEQYCSIFLHCSIICQRNRLSNLNSLNLVFEFVQICINSVLVEMNLTKSQLWFLFRPVEKGKQLGIRVCFWFFLGFFFFFAFHAKSGTYISIEMGWVIHHNKAFSVVIHSFFYFQVVFLQISTTLLWVLNIPTFQIFDKEKNDPNLKVNFCVFLHCVRNIICYLHSNVTGYPCSFYLD